MSVIQPTNREFVPTLLKAMLIYVIVATWRKSPKNS
jgi:hypothetical protein